MSIGKQFKKKMKNPKAGNSYWRIWGWPIKPHTRQYFEDMSDGVLVDGIFETIWLMIESDTLTGKEYRSLTNRRQLNGTVLGYYRTRKQAWTALQEIKNGYHPSVLAEIVFYHADIDRFDEFLDSTFGDRDDEADYYLDQEGMVETPVEQVVTDVIGSSKTMDQYFVEKLQQNGMFEK